MPRLLGYKNAKYLVRIEATDHLEDGFWEFNGHSHDGEVTGERLRPGKHRDTPYSSSASARAT